MENILSVTAINTREIYNVIQWLKGCIIKKMAKGVTSKKFYRMTDYKMRDLASKILDWEAISKTIEL